MSSSTWTRPIQQITDKTRHHEIINKVSFRNMIVLMDFFLSINCACVLGQNAEQLSADSVSCLFYNIMFL